MLLSAKRQLKEQRRTERATLSRAGQQLAQHLGISGVSESLAIVVDDAPPTPVQAAANPSPWIPVTQPVPPPIVVSSGASTPAVGNAPACNVGTGPNPVAASTPIAATSSLEVPVLSDIGGAIKTLVEKAVTDPTLWGVINKLRRRRAVPRT